MIRNIILALIAVIGTTAFAENTTTNNLSANTIAISATVDQKDIVNIHGDKIWFAHVAGEYPTNILVNGNTWIPKWDAEQEVVVLSDTFTMKQPPRFLPMTARRGLLSISLVQKNATSTVIEYPDAVNEWVLVVLLNNPNNEPTRMDLIISWKDDAIPVVFPSHSVTHTKPDPTPTGLR